MQPPEIVDEEQWESYHEALLTKEKQATRDRDALAAERRRQPMVEISADYPFEGPEGEVTLLDLFEGRSQLLVYHFYFPAGGDPCGGCTMFTDQISPIAHLHARDTSFALVSPAAQAAIEPYKRRMGWEVPWYTTVGDEFQRARGTTEYFKLDIYIRDGDRVYLTYSTTARGVEALGSVWTFLDLTPFGRQEEWEDTPPGRPQTPPYQWWRRRDEYEASGTGR
jgi:predicted dithiol-disulfide oxidoreductase (DUF899 family)